MKKKVDFEMTPTQSDEQAQPITKCDCCEGEGATRYRQNTQYIEEERNWVTLCPECRKENDEHWADMWSDFWSDFWSDKL